MTSAEKLTMLKTMMYDMDNMPEDAVLTTFLEFAKNEILNWLYSAVGAVPDDVTDVPVFWETEQIMAVIAGISISGAENQTTHNENGISRAFKYSDMVAHIRNNIIPYAGVVS
mgnify:CR=1 FL=1